MPRIQFCRSASGRALAYAIDGQGPYLVLPAWWVSHVEKDWSSPAFRAFFESLARQHTVVRYDRLGVGMSDRERDAVTPDAEYADFEALVNHLGCERLALLGMSCGGGPAVRYAASHPDRVSHLVLYGTCIMGRDIARDEVKAAVTSLVRAHWGLGSRALTDIFVPSIGSEEATAFAALQRASASAEMAAALLTLTYEIDVADVVDRVSVPTLVLHRKGDRAVAFEHGRALAARIAGATLVPLEGNAHPPWYGNGAAVAEAVNAFLGGSRQPAAADLPNELVRAGDVWVARHVGKEAHLKHCVGLSDIALLVANPRHEISAVDLLAGVSCEKLPDLGADPVLDDRAHRAYRARLSALEEEIRTAEEQGQADGADRAEKERSALVAEMRAAAGIGRRRRSLGAPMERARKAVTARIRDAVEKIRDVHPELARHLDATIRTGTHCRYEPSAPMTWRT